MPIRKVSPNPYAITEASSTMMTQANPPTSKVNPYDMPNYRCPNPDCKGRSVQTFAVHLAIYRGQLLTWPCLLSDACWKIFFIGAGFTAAVFTVFGRPALAASVSSMPTIGSAFGFVLMIGAICILYAFVRYYLLPPKIKIEVHRCRPCRYVWAQFLSPTEAISQWVEGEMSRATKRGNKREIAQTLVAFCSLASQKKDWPLAESYATQCLRLSQDAKSDKTTALALHYLGLVALFRGQYQAAASHFETCLGQYRKLKDWQNIAYSLNNLGLARLYQSAPDGIAALFAESLSFTAWMDDTLGISWSCAGQASLAAVQDQPERAARLYGVSRRLYEAAGAHALALDDCPGFKQSVAATRARLGDDKYDKAWRAGHALSRRDAIIYCCRQPTESLIELIADLEKDDVTAYKATLKLGYVGDPRAVEPLILALRRTSPEVREGAAIALGQIGDPRAIEPLIAILPDFGDDEYRPGECARGALVEIGESAVAPIIQALQHPDAGVRFEAVGILGALQGVQAIDLILAALRDSDPGVRVSAAQTLGMLGDLRAVPELERVVRKDRGMFWEHAVANAARYALKQIRRMHSASWREQLAAALRKLRGRAV